MPVLTRTTTTPDSPLQVQVDQSQGDGDGGFQVGGVFWFMPAGQDGDSHQVTDHVAEVIMGDPGLAPHFTCVPPITQQPDSATATSGRSKKATKASDAAASGDTQ